MAEVAHAGLAEIAERLEATGLPLSAEYDPETTMLLVHVSGKFLPLMAVHYIRSGVRDNCPFVLTTEGYLLQELGGNALGRLNADDAVVYVLACYALDHAKTFDLATGFSTPCTCTDHDTCDACIDAGVLDN